MKYSPLQCISLYKPMFLLKAYWIASCTIEKLGVMVSYIVAINNSVTQSD